MLKVRQESWFFYWQILVPDLENLADQIFKVYFDFLISTFVAESSKIPETGGVFQTEKTAIISFSRVFLRKLCTKTELTQSFCTIFRRSNERDFREEFARIRQRFAKLRLKIQPDTENQNADNSATSTPIKERLCSLDSPH